MLTLPAAFRASRFRGGVRSVSCRRGRALSGGAVRCLCLLKAVMVGWGTVAWLCCICWPWPSAAQSMIDQDFAVLRVLDKTAARVELLQIAVGEAIQLRRLQLTVRACREPPPLEDPESVAFLEVIEHRLGKSGDVIFQGWMFASSTGLSVMEHPVYDIWVVDCIPILPEVLE